MLPQIIILSILLIRLIYVSAEHGYSRHKVINFWSELIKISIIFFLLLWGGFFDMN